METGIFCKFSFTISRKFYSFSDFTCKNFTDVVKRYKIVYNRRESRKAPEHL